MRISAAASALTARWHSRVPPPEQHLNTTNGCPAPPNVEAPGTRSIPCRGLYDPASYVHAGRAGGAGECCGGFGGFWRYCSITHVGHGNRYPRGGVPSGAAGEQSLFTMTKARVNAAVHQKLNTTLARVNPEVMSKPEMQKHLRAARESLTKQEIPTQANSVVTLCAAVAMVLLLCATIAGTSLPATFFVAGHMTILVSHRAWTLRHADSIYVMDAGAIVESGTYTELMARNSHFAQLFASQAG